MTNFTHDDLAALRHNVSSTKENRSLTIGIVIINSYRTNVLVRDTQKIGMCSTTAHAVPGQHQRLANRWSGVQSSHPAPYISIA